MIVIKIDVTKIDKLRLFPGKNGAKYLDLALIENKNGEDQYGNTHMVVQSVSKEERENGIKGPILGNAKTIGRADGPRPPSISPAPAPAPSTREQDDDIPF